MFKKILISTIIVLGIVNLTIAHAYKNRIFFKNGFHEDIITIYPNMEANHCVKDFSLQSLVLKPQESGVIEFTVLDDTSKPKCSDNVRQASFNLRIWGRPVSDDFVNFVTAYRQGGTTRCDTRDLKFYNTCKFDGEGSFISEVWFPKAFKV